MLVPGGFDVAYARFPIQPGRCAPARTAEFSKVLKQTAPERTETPHSALLHTKTGGRAYGGPRKQFQMFRNGKKKEKKKRKEKKRKEKAMSTQPTFLQNLSHRSDHLLSATATLQQNT